MYKSDHEIGNPHVKSPHSHWRRVVSSALPRLKDSIFNGKNRKDRNQAPCLLSLFLPWETYSGRQASALPCIWWDCLLPSHRTRTQNVLYVHFRVGNPHSIHGPCRNNHLETLLNCHKQIYLSQMQILQWSLPGRGRKGLYSSVSIREKDYGSSHREQGLENHREFPVFKNKGNSPKKAVTIDRVKEGWGKLWVGDSAEGKRWL